MAKPKPWYLEDGNHNSGLRTVRDLQPKVRKLGYHILLGGGVLNKGFSDKDLDLYFMPLVGVEHDRFALLRLLGKEWGEGSEIGSGGTDEEDSWYANKIMYDTPTGRIDVFVVDDRPKPETDKEVNVGALDAAF